MDEEQQNGRPWYDGIPGLDPRLPVPDIRWANGVAALYCAQRCTGPIAPVDGQYAGRNKLADVAAHFSRWLDEALEDEDDWEGLPPDELAAAQARVAVAAYSRRLCLAFACDNPGARPAQRAVTATADLYTPILGAQAHPRPRTRRASAG